MKTYLMMETMTCLACGRDGSLLLCSEEGCEFAIHDKCMPCNAYFDASGSFYCPRCSYDLAVEECNQAKKHASLAKQALLKFISAVNSKDERPEVEGIKGKHPVSGTSENDDFHLSQGVEVGEKDNSEICKGTDSTNKFLESEILVNPGLIQNCHETETKTVIELPCISGAATKKGITDELQEENSGKDELFVDDSDISDSDLGTPVNPKLKVKRVLREKINVKYARRSSNDLDTQNGDADESVKQGQDRNLKKSSRKRKSSHSDDQGNNATPTKIRPRKQWSDAEVEILKEGVQKFSVPNAKMPWGKILEHGSHVFEHYRTAVDLKDKWRNLTK